MTRIRVLTVGCSGTTSHSGISEKIKNRLLPRYICHSRSTIWAGEGFTVAPQNGSLALKPRQNAFRKVGGAINSSTSGGPRHPHWKFLKIFFKQPRSLLLLLLAFNLPEPLSEQVHPSTVLAVITAPMCPHPFVTNFSARISPNLHELNETTMWD